MTKITVTLGIVGGKPAVIKEPSLDPEDHIKALRELTRADGRIKSGKSEKQVSEAQIVHTVKGVIKKRKF